MQAEMESVEQATTIQLLTFSLNSETFGADITQIQEVLEYAEVTRVPRMPSHMVGVINLRGKVLPVVDLHQMFAMPAVEFTVDTCIVIIEIVVNEQAISLGLIADAVKEVIILEANQVSPPPKIGTTIDTSFIEGMGKYQEEFIIILDLVNMFTDEALDEIQQAGEVHG